MEKIYGIVVYARRCIVPLTIKMIVECFTGFLNGHRRNRATSFMILLLKSGQLQETAANLI